ncbi:MAG: 3-deoxy-7-phosphoheptulonate synthase, partial [Steroidobacteraceae bacterium]
MKAPDSTTWSPTSWQTRKALQQPQYADQAALAAAVAQLSRLPPLVVSWEVDALRGHLAAAQRGEAFLLQGGDCAESFEGCESDRIAKQLKVLLLVRLVLLHGLKRPIVRVGRMAGQYAKPRST